MRGSRQRGDGSVTTARNRLATNTSGAATSSSTPTATVVCPHLVDELAGVLHRPKFRPFLTIDESDQAVELLARVAEHHDDPSDVPLWSRDPNDDYLLALAVDAEAAALVSGDKDLTTVEAGDMTVLTPAALLELLESHDAQPAEQGPPGDV